MKTVLCMTITLNGMIARENGKEDFLSDNNWTAFAKKANEIGCLIWGRKTYEHVLELGQSYLTDLERVKKIIVSHQDLKLQEGFSLVHTPQEALELAKTWGFQIVLLPGGSTTNSAFAKLGFIDELIVFVNPYILGKGKPLFFPDLFEFSLEILKVQSMGSGIVMLHYRVKR